MWDGTRHRLVRQAEDPAWPEFPPLGDTVATGLAALQPDARIVAILRDPVERLFSDYLYFNKDLDQEKDGESFHNLSVAAVTRWENCTESRTEEDCITDRSVVLSFGMVRLHVGLYALHLDQWLHEFGRQQVLVLRTEDYRSNVTQSLRRIFTHLGLEEPTASVWEKIRNSRTLNVRRGRLKTKRMLPETRRLLQEFHRPFNERLSRLLGSHRFTWEDTRKTEDTDS